MTEFIFDVEFKLSLPRIVLHLIKILTGFDLVVQV